MNKQYIGARYVPKFYEGSDGINWENNTEYEPLTIVRYLNDTYTSKIPVPSTVGNPKSNPKYWARTGTYNAQVEEFRAEVTERLDNGVLGNGEYNPDISPVAYADDFNFNGSLINHSTSETVETDDECPTPVIVAQKEVTYVDKDATADENFKFPVSQYNEGILEGYSANENEANTQNFTNVLSNVKHNIAGVVGACCFGGRMYMGGLSDVPAMGTYGGNKGAVYDGHLFTKTEYSLGGYGIGAEFGIFDQCDTGVSPVYENNDYNVFTRKTHVMNIVGGGNKQPITAGVVIMGVGSANSMWNGIIMGGTSMLITKDGVKQGGVKGTVGINFASWRDYNNGVGGFGHTAIKFGKAYRHIDAIAGFIVSSPTHEFLNRSNDAHNYFRLVAPTTKTNHIQFGYVEDVTADNINANVNAQIVGSENSLLVEGINTPIRIYDIERVEGQEDVNHGIMITQNSFTPITTSMINGSYEYPWTFVASNNYQWIYNNDVAVLETASADNNAILSMNKPFRVVDRTVTDGSADYGIEIGNSYVNPSNYNTTIGDATHHWKQIYVDTITLGNTTLTQTQLDRLLALLS